MKPWRHRYLYVKHGSIDSGHASIDEAHVAHRERQRRAGFRIDFGEVIDTWTEPGAQVPVTGDCGRVMWYRWDSTSGPPIDEADPMGIGARFAAMELR